MSSGDLSAQIPRNLITRIQERFWVGPAHPVARELREGDQLGEWTVIETPGHSPGHVVFWRESDRTLIMGDVLVNMNLLTTAPGLAEPPRQFLAVGAFARRLSDRMAPAPASKKKVADDDEADDGEPDQQERHSHFEAHQTRAHSRVLTISPECERRRNRRRLDLGAGLPRPPRAEPDPRRRARLRREGLLAPSPRRAPARTLRS